MLYWIIPFFTNHRITAHNRTSRKKSDDDDYGGYSYRAAKTFLFYRVCFGCFFVFVVIKNQHRGPPLTIEVYQILIGGSNVKKIFEQIFKRYQKLIPLDCIIVLKEGGDGYAG